MSASDELIYCFVALGHGLNFKEAQAAIGLLDAPEQYRLRKDLYEAGYKRSLSADDLKRESFRDIERFVLRLYRYVLGLPVLPNTLPHQESLDLCGLIASQDRKFGELFRRKIHQQTARRYADDRQRRNRRPRNTETSI